MTILLTSLGLSEYGQHVMQRAECDRSASVTENCYKGMSAGQVSDQIQLEIGLFRNEWRLMQKNTSVQQKNPNPSNLSDCSICLNCANNILSS